MAIKVKGRTPEYTYVYTLTEIFDSVQGNAFSVGECVSRLNANGLALAEHKLMRKLFGYRTATRPSDVVDAVLPFSFAGPFQMRSVVRGQFYFNLQYQDAVIKIELEKLFGGDEYASRRDAILHKALLVVATVLNTAFFSDEPVYLELTNMELDHVVMMCLELIWGEDESTVRYLGDLIASGRTANVIAYLVQHEFLTVNDMTIDDVLPFLLYSGIVWWSDYEVQTKFRFSHQEIIHELFDQLKNHIEKPIAINDLKFFREEVLRGSQRKKILYFLDDNGELVWAMFFIRLLLNANPNLTIKCVVNSIPVTNNSNTTTLYEYLKTDGQFLGLLDDNRFEVHGEANELPAIDLRFISPELRTFIDEADVLFVNGVSFYEKLQYLPRPTYYIFTVYSETSKILTGLDRGLGVFARLGPHMCGFSHIQDEDMRAKPKMVLSRIHSAANSDAYRHIMDKLGSEEDTNLWLRKKSEENKLTLEQAILQADV